MCPKCKNENRVKSGFHRGKQRYLCKNCGCNYVEKPFKGYPPSIKKKAIQYYLEGNGFRRIERLLGVSHVSVINWVKQTASKVESYAEKTKKPRKVKVLELDEMCVNFKKKSGFGRR
jgi:transposase-like protein